MVVKKEEWQKRFPQSASLSIKKKFSLSVEPELDELRIKLGLGGWTELNKQFQLEKIGMTERDFDKMLHNFILEKMDISSGDYAKEFRHFLSEIIHGEVEDDQLKKRWGEYVENKEYL